MASNIDHVGEIANSGEIIICFLFKQNSFSMKILQISLKLNLNLLLNFFLNILRLLLKIDIMFIFFRYFIWQCIWESFKPWARLTTYSTQKVEVYTLHQHHLVTLYSYYSNVSFILSFIINFHNVSMIVIINNYNNT